MPGFIGEFPCTMDAKGRFNVPAALLKQVPAKEQKRFVVHRGIEKHISFYIHKEGMGENQRRGQQEVNIYIKKNRDFIRIFNRGATEIELDSATNRLLLPKGLTDYAGIDRDIVLFAFGNRVEIWSERGYEKMLKEDKNGFF